MRKWLVGLCAIFIAMPVWADVSNEALLNTITLQLTAEQWVTTKSALVTVGVNASVSDNDLGKIQAQVIQKLHQLSSSDEWHVTSFMRSEDQSGLEKVQISAQARLPEAELTGLRQKAKSISKPGETYTLDNVDFSPSEGEVRAANTLLRTQIYQQATDEIARLNKLYPDQKYYVHAVNFLGQMMPMPRAANMMLMQNRAEVSKVASLAVGEKLTVVGTVQLASVPNADVMKLIH